MATIRPFNLFDMLEYNNINLDILTETVTKYFNYFFFKFSTHFYGSYFSKWSEYSIAMVNCTGYFQSYCILIIFLIFFSVLGKVEGDLKDDEKKNWHGHLSVII